MDLNRYYNEMFGEYQGDPAEIRAEANGRLEMKMDQLREREQKGQERQEVIRLESLKPKCKVCGESKGKPNQLYIFEDVGWSKLKVEIDLDAKVCQRCLPKLLLAVCSRC